MAGRVAAISEPVVTAARSPLIVWPAIAAPTVSVVIVTYGDTPTLLATLAALARHHRPRELPVEVIVVVHPDATGASTSDMLATSTAGLTMVVPGENLGFAGGCNRGVGVARGDVIALVNPDLVVVEGWLEPLLAALVDPVVAIAAPPLLELDGSIQEAGQVIFADGGTDPIGGPRMFTNDPMVLFDRDVDYASGACWVMTRNRFESLGGFDTAYHPAYFEDADLAMRVEASGAVTRLVTSHPLLHHRGGTSAPSAATLALAQRSRMVFETRWASELTRRVVRPADGVLDEITMLEARDRLCRQRMVHVLAGTSSQITAAVTELAAMARSRPRDRITVLVDPAYGDVSARESWHRMTQPAGAELVIGDAVMTLRRRSGWWSSVVVNARSWEPAGIDAAIAELAGLERYPAR